MKKIIQVQNLTHSFQQTQLFFGLHLSLFEEESIAVVGPSGCGKSTLLRLLAGLLPTPKGMIERDQSLEKKIAFVFQEPGLLPWKTAEENVQLPQQLLISKNFPEAGKWLKLVGLEMDQKKFPHELSGGMRMRTSIARALSTEPRLIFLDEPFSALDELTRENLILDFIGLQRQLRFSIMMVTHSLSEALQLADRILIFSKQGKLVQEVVNPLARTTSDLQQSSAFQTELKKLKAQFRLLVNA